VGYWTFAVIVTSCIWLIAETIISIFRANFIVRSKNFSLSVSTLISQSWRWVNFLFNLVAQSHHCLQSLTFGLWFYRAMLCWRGICCRHVSVSSSVRPSVRLSVTRRYCTKTA